MRTVSVKSYHIGSEILSYSPISLCVSQAGVLQGKLHELQHTERTVATLMEESYWLMF